MQVFCVTSTIHPLCAVPSQDNEGIGKKGDGGAEGASVVTGR